MSVAATDSVTVHRQAQDLLEQTTNTVGQVIDNRTHAAVTAQRAANYLQLGNLTAGTVPELPAPRDLTFSAYGNRGPPETRFLLDGWRGQTKTTCADSTTAARDAMRPSPRSRFGV